MKSEALVGNWCKLLEEEFFKPYMKDISNKVKESKDNIFRGHSKIQPFLHFKSIDPDNIKCVYIIETLASVKRVNLEIEKEIFDGFDILLSMEDNVNWLASQGIFIYPRCLSWDDYGTHKFWYPFTNKVLELIIQSKPNTLIVSDEDDLVKHLSIYSNNTMSGGKYVWKAIQAYCNENFEDKVIWHPLPF